MPLLTGRPVGVDGRLFVDAGISEAVPVRAALKDHATHIVALRTRREDEVASPPGRAEKMILQRWLARNAPGAAKPWRERVAQRAEEERLLKDALQIRPPLGSARISRTERRPAPMRAAVDVAIAAAMETFAAL
jgi:predicted patatin/cPLA2 family phospholipase